MFLPGGIWATVAASFAMTSATFDDSPISASVFVIFFGVLQGSNKNHSERQCCS